jgi:N-acetylglucosaminyldiphosphoundecaprenol N-acetyl-beta-D-mannosaminyltransferase
MKQKLERELPNLQIAGMEPLPFKPLTPTEDEALVQKINASGAGLVLVCLGCPKQEYWMIEHLNKINAVMIGVGAVFALYAGIHKRAPRIVRESGLEWFYRLVQEPQRLWHRYSQTIPPFMLLASKQLLEQLKIQSSQNIVGGLPSVKRDRPFANTGIDFLVLDSEPSKIGEILVRQNLIEEGALSIALEKQRYDQKKIGEVLIEQGFISEVELEYYLKNQTIKLGELLVESSLVSSNRLNRLLERQKLSNQKLGELLIEQKILSTEQLQQFLLEQYWRHHGLWLMADGTSESLSDRPADLRLSNQF